MNLTEKEFNTMTFLLGKHRHFPLSIEEKSELRTLIYKERQFCPLAFDKMIEYGLILVGTYTILETYIEEIKIKHYLNYIGSSSTYCGKDMNDVEKDNERAVICVEHATCPDCLKLIDDEIKELNKEE